MQYKAKVLMPDIMKVEHNVRVLQEAKSLKDNGFDVKIIGFSNKSKKKYFKLNGIDVISFYLHDERKGFGKIYRYLSAIKMLLGINIYVLFSKADFYHAHNFHVLPACAISAFFHNGKLVYDSHETWTIHKNRKYHPEHIFAFIFEKTFLRFIDGFVTINEMVADFYNEKYQVKEAIVLYNTRPLIPLVSINLIRKELGLNEEKKIALFVGGFWPTGRGILELIQSSQYLDNNLVIVLMGYGSDNMLNRMKEKIKRMRAENRVFILPPQPPEKVMDYVMSADIGMNLIKRESRAQDFQSPWKLFEYCMGGLPVISTDLPFHKKIYQKYNIGILCDKKNSPKSIADSIKRLTENKAVFLKFGKNARMLAVKEFNWEIQEKKLLNIYKEVLK